MSRFDGVVRIGVNVDDQQATDSPNNLMRAFKGAFKVIGGIVAAFTAANFLNESIAMAESVRQLDRAMEVTFGDNLGLARQRADEIARSMGMLGGSMDYNFTKFSRAWLMDGKNINEAMALTERQLRVVGDGAVGLGKDTDYLTDRLMAFMKGNNQALIGLGINADQNDINAWALREHGASWDDLTSSQQKAMRLGFVEYIYDLANMTGLAGENFLSLDVAQANVNGQWERFRAILGQPFLEGKVNVLRQAAYALEWFNDLLEDSNSVGEVVNGLWDGMRSVISRLQETFINFFINADPMPLLNKFIDFLPKIFGILIGGMPSLLFKGVQMIENIADGMDLTVPELLNKISEMLTGVLQEILGRLPDMLKSGIEMISNILNGMMEMLPAILEFGTTMISSLVETITEMLPIILSTGIELLQTLIRGIRDTLPDLLVAALQLIIDFSMEILRNLPTIISTGVELLTSLIDGILNTMPDLLLLGLELIIRFVAQILRNLPEMFSLGGDIISALIDGIGDMLGGLWDAARNIGSTILGGIRNFLGINSPSREMRSIGESTIDGLQDGMNRRESGLMSRARGIASGITRTLQNALNISSPSRVMRDLVGGPIVDGIASGIDRYSDSAINEARDLVSSLTGGAESAINVRNDRNHARSAASLSGDGRSESDVDKSKDDSMTVVLNVDGREFARATALYTDREIQERKVRIRASRGRVTT